MTPDDGTGMVLNPELVVLTGVVTESDPARHPAVTQQYFTTLLDPVDETVVEAQLGRTPRGAVGVAWRCPCGKPGVVMTAPRLGDGTPFPTTYYLTCPNAVRACSTLEGDGRMAEMTERLRKDPILAAGYSEAHLSYLADRKALSEALELEVPEIAGISAGGMPERVKCLHALVAHSLAKGPGVNPLGDEAVAAMGEVWDPPCLNQGVRSAGSAVSQGVRSAGSVKHGVRSAGSSDTTPGHVAGLPAIDLGRGGSRDIPVVLESP